MIYAYILNSADIAKTPKHSSRGYFTIEIMEDGTIKDYVEPEPEPESTFNLYLFHGWMMWAAWSFLGFIQLLTNRYLKQFWSVKMWIHRIAGSLIWIITLVAGILLIKDLGWEI